jgi:ABC-type polysaccharide/polyol phosphate transport system ATPase subunit
LPTSSSSQGSEVLSGSSGRGAAVRFEHVSKRYRLGAGQNSLRETLSQILPRVRKQKAGTLPDKQVLWALQDLSFELTAGRALGLIGPNGAGKTTALKLMAHITQPTSGRIEMKGRVSALIELGAGFHAELTGRENIYLNAAILGMPLKEAERLFDQIVEFSGLERFLDTPVKRYSSGMYVRLGFSVAAHVDPDVLLVDEVLAVGDAQFRQKCAQRIAELRAKGTTIVFVSHIMPLVRSVCDEGILLTDGQIQAQGDVVEVIRAYETYLQRLQMESPPEKPLDSLDPSCAATVAIRQVEIRSLGMGNKTGDELHYNDAAEVRVHFAVQEPIHQPSLVVRILGADGAVSCMIRSLDYGYVLDGIAGEGVIAVAIDPLQLASGAYTIEARLLGALEGTPLAMGHSPWFQVAGLSIGNLRTGGVFVPHVAGIRVEPAEASGTGQEDAPGRPSAEPLPGELGS